MRGLIHIYEGDGKGKTTCGVGLSVRFAGNGGKVLYAQFLKDNQSSELAALEKIPGITLLLPDRFFGFSWTMTEEQKAEAKAYYTTYLDQVLEEALSKQAGLLVLDEIVGAYAKGFIDRDRLLTFLKNKPEELEVVMTGRHPSPELCEMADYISCIEKKKHPFDRGIPARKGIEK